MRCEQIQERMLEEQGGEDPAVRAHCERCAECAEVMKLVRALEMRGQAAREKDLSGDAIRRVEREAHAILRRGVALKTEPNWAGWQRLVRVAAALVIALGLWGILTRVAPKGGRAVDGRVMERAAFISAAMQPSLQDQEISAVSFLTEQKFRDFSGGGRRPSRAAMEDQADVLRTQIRDSAFEIEQELRSAMMPRWKTGDDSSASGSGEGA